MPLIPRPSFRCASLPLRPLVALVTMSLLGLALLSGSGCDKKHRIVANQPPTLTLTNGPIDTVTAPQSWIINMAWVANDPDGSIDHFEYAIDPPTSHAARFALQETTWVSTTEHAVVVRFRASRPDSLGPGATASEFHTFVLRAIDNNGLPSAVLARSFYARTVAPDVAITRPVPSALLQAQVPAPFRLVWAGNDPDGDPDTRPAGYRFLILDISDPSNWRYLSDPDSLFKLGSGTGWADWRFISGDTTSLDLVQLTPTKTYMAVLLAVDQAGATTPYVDLRRNALQFSVTFPAAGAPRVHVSSPLVDFTYADGGFVNLPSREIPVQAAALNGIEFHWDAIPSPGRVIETSRWKLDGDPNDDIVGNPLQGFWSTLSGPTGRVPLTFREPGTHRFFIEVRDDFGERSLAIVRIEVFANNPSRALLVIDDTRLEPDRFGTGGTPLAYTRPWPSATELDTFLYARGGVPWRGARDPAGALSVPGLLAGYDFDTLGTQRGLENPANAVPLHAIATYQHVIWLVDPSGAAASPVPPFPMSALRAMSGPGLPSTLAAYVEGGGRVWLAGGGAASASLLNFNRPNDAGGLLFTFDDGELGVGRPMYDHAHVHSALAVNVLSSAPERSPAARGGWSGQGPDGVLSAPDYTKLPATLRFRTGATDPIPPTRLASQGNLFYLGNTQYEYVAAPNEITEPVTPGFRDEVWSTLDTLYEVSSGLARVSPAPVMTYYHGRDNVPFIFSGFAPWMWTRADAQGLVDFVLQDLWGIPKAAPSAGSVRANVPGSGTGVRRTSTRVTAVRRLDPSGSHP